MVKMMLRLLLIFCFLLQSPVPATADDSSEKDTNQAKKSVESLLEEAKELLNEEHPIEARVKLYEALELSPNDYRPHLQLAQYYLLRVGHFSLAYRLAHQAEALFSKQHGSEINNTLDINYWKDHALILYTLAEASLNFDKYEESLATLQRFEKVYSDSWLHGTKAWVLLKLKRYDEAIAAAKVGLAGSSDNTRTFNILGILLSITGQRQASLNAFAKALENELRDGAIGQPATPLNNAGEVYREVFRDDYAEASWVKARNFPDGCDHVLPSLNLATLLIDESRLFAAERTLADFEACFAQHSIRTDTEHRGLLALSRGRILLRKGEVDAAVEQLTTALERQQWYGKIGTDLNDLVLAANISLAQALDAQSAVLADTHFNSIHEKLLAIIQRQWLSIRSWWLRRKARQIAVNKLEDFEDLWVRHTDAMVEYPTLGNFTSGFSEDGFAARIKSMLQLDLRPLVHSYYQLYLAENTLTHGNPDEALSLLKIAEPDLRPFDRLAQAEVLRIELLAQKKLHGWWRNNDEIAQEAAIAENIYEIIPSHLRIYDLSLPVETTFSQTSGCNGVEEELIDMLTQTRFENLTALNLKGRYNLSARGECKDGNRLKIALQNSQTGKTVVSLTKDISDSKDLKDLANEMIQKTFEHHIDPPSRILPPLPILPASFR